MEKYSYDYNDSKTIVVDGQKQKLYRVVANREITNPYYTVKKGERGGYVADGALSQEGECWVTDSSFVAESCFVGGDGYVDCSTLFKNVSVLNSAAVSDSTIDSSKVSSLTGGSIVVGSKIVGNINLSGMARVDTCYVSGGLSMTDDATLWDCEVHGVDEGLSLVADLKYSKKKIVGSGPINCGAIVIDKERTK
ncbi:MAG: hypothetical protein J6K39_03595 [Clostridia bacterium]|nr:hypothetical protein [Clostridia bacterium]